MRYFHVPLCQISDNRVRFSGRELHHLVNVVRLREGDEITVLDGSGGIYEVSLTSCGQDVAVGEIKTCRQAQPPLVEATIFVGLPKADKMDMIVQKATELGAYRIVPVVCQYSVPQLSVKRAERRVARWRQIAVEASKQSHRPFFPFISDVLRFDNALEDSQAEFKLIFVTEGITSIAPKRLRDVLRMNVEAKKVDIFIGPEGGFAEHEVCRALSVGAAPVSLGNNILRTETAAMAALTIILYEMDQTHERTSA